MSVGNFISGRTKADSGACFVAVWSSVIHPSESLDRLECLARRHAPPSGQEELEPPVSFPRTADTHARPLPVSLSSLGLALCITRPWTRPQERTRRPSWLGGDHGSADNLLAPSFRASYVNHPMHPVLPAAPACVLAKLRSTLLARMFHGDATPSSRFVRKSAARTSRLQMTAWEEACRGCEPSRRSSQSAGGD